MMAVMVLNGHCDSSGAMAGVQLRLPIVQQHHHRTCSLMWYKLVIVVDVVVSRRYIFLHNVVFFFMALFGTDSYVLNGD